MCVERWFIPHFLKCIHLISFLNIVGHPASARLSKSKSSIFQQHLKQAVLNCYVHSVCDLYCCVGISCREAHVDTLFCWVLMFLSSYLLLQNGFCSSSVINRAGQKSHLMCWYKRTVFRLIHTFTRDYCVHTNLDKWLQPLLCLLDFSFLSDTTSCQLAHKFCNYTNN